VPRNLKRYYGAGDLHFVTFSCYQRLALLAGGRRRDLFLRALEATRLKYGMLVVGYVVMPEHVHLLVSEPGRQNLSTAIKALKQSVSRRVLRRWRMAAGQGNLFSDEVQRQRFWQARFYDFNVWSAKKRIEKLRYMHRNPVKRGLVTRPELWRWSSFRYYAYGEPGPVAVNAMLPLHWTAKKCTAA
jgi:putative transposase